MLKKSPRIITPEAAKSFGDSRVPLDPRAIDRAQIDEDIIRAIRLGGCTTVAKIFNDLFQTYSRLQKSIRLKTVQKRVAAILQELNLHHISDLVSALASRPDSFGASSNVVTFPVAAPEPVLIMASDEAIKQALNIPREIRERVKREPGVLTPQETKILTLAAQGLINRDIGTRLALTKGQVALHMYTIFNQLGLEGDDRTREKAVERAVERRLIKGAQEPGPVALEPDGLS